MGTNNGQNNLTGIITPTPVVETSVAGNGTAYRGQNISAVRPSAFTGVVNTLVGDAQVTATDINYNRNGFPLKFERYFHNGITSPFGEMGPNWASNYDLCLFVPLVNIDHVILSLPHQSWKFTSSDGGNTFARPAGCFYQLRPMATSDVIANPPSDFTGTTYVVTDNSGYVFKFNVLTDGEPNVARLVEMDDLNGNKVVLTYQPYTVYSLTEYYNGSPFPIFSYSLPRLQSVTGNNWSLNFSYYDNATPANVTVINANINISFQGNYTGGRLKQVTDSAGDILTFDTTAPDGSYTNSGPVTSVKRAHNGDSYEMDAKYQYYAHQYFPSNSGPVSVFTLKQAVDPLAAAGSRNLTYVSQNNPNTFNNPVRQTLNGMNQVVYTYDYSQDSSGDQLTGISGANGQFETDVYDSTGNMIRKRFTVDGHPFNSTYTWNQDGLLTNTVDGNGNATTMAYDSLGNMTYRKDAEGYFETNTYSTVGVNGVGANIIRLTKAVDKNQVVRYYDYDGAGNLLHTYEPGRTTAYHYTYSNGSLIQKTVTDANNHTTTTNYDTNENVVSVQEPAIGPPENLPGATTSYVYDSETNGTGRNLLQSATDPLNQTISYTYQNNVWLQTASYPDNTTEQYTYDSNGNELSSQDRNGTLTKYSYDGADRQTDIYGAYGTADVRHTQKTYDALGNMTSLVDNKGQKTTFAYDEQSQVRTMTDSLGKGATNDYDGALNVIQSKDTRGITKSLTYYKNNRLKSARFSDGSPSLSYTYDGNGNRMGITDGIGPKTYTYDPLNNLLTATDSARNFNLTYAYDAVGNRLSMQNNLISGTTYYSYYENNSLKTVTDVDGTITSFIYDAIKNPALTLYSNGVTVAYNYFPTTHRLQILQNLNSSGEVLSSFSYTYDNVGNQKSMTDLSGTTNYVYDNLYQLKAAQYTGPQGTVGYGYDGVGNRTTLTQNGVSQPFSYDSGNELQNGLNENFSYDQTGNTTQRSSPAGTTTYKWDALNELVKVTMPSGIVSFFYDGDGHRVQKTTSNGTINYFYSGNSVIVETGVNGNILKSYLPGISVKDQQGNKLFYLRNGHGDTAGMMDVNQNLTQSYVYDAFGKSLGVQKDTNNYRYVGSGDVFSDDDINLQYMWHRWYDPRLGRFISRDPKGLGGGLNLYAYCSNNPISSIDPMGLEGYGHYWMYRQHELESSVLEAAATDIEFYAEVELGPLGLIAFLGGIEMDEIGDYSRDHYIPEQTQTEITIWNRYIGGYISQHPGESIGGPTITDSGQFKYQGSIITFSTVQGFVAARDAAMAAQVQASYISQSETQAQNNAQYIAAAAAAAAAAQLGGGSGPQGGGGGGSTGDGQGHCTSGCDGPGT